jgi:ornithine--oxo-acid transaminase
MVLPMNTGAEAVETALKLARKWAYKKKGVPQVSSSKSPMTSPCRLRLGSQDEAIILSVSDNFHGRTLGIVSMSSDPDVSAGPALLTARLRPLG